MKLEESQKYDIETTLADIIRTIWSGKWTIIGVSAVTCIITIIYLMVITPTYKGVLEIFPISINEVSKYNDLNSSKLISECAEREEGTTEQGTNINCNVIDNQKLISMFIQDLFTYESIERSIKQNMYLKKNKNETELEFSSRVRKVARTFFISKKENKKSRDIVQQKYVWILSFTTDQPDLAVKVISDSLLHSNNNVSMQVKSQIDKIMESHSRRIRMELEDLDISTKLLLQKEKLGTQSRLAFLSEQKTMAHSLGIEKNVLFLQRYSPEIVMDTFISKGEIPYYYRGVLSIEKEMEMLSSRVLSILHIDEALDNKIKREQLLQDKTLTRTQNFASLTPIGKDNFKSINYDLISIGFKSQINQKLILAISIILGGILGLFGLVIRRSLNFTQ